MFILRCAFNAMILRDWLCQGCMYLLSATSNLEPFLVLSFSVERLIAVLRPFQVCR